MGLMMYDFRLEYEYAEHRYMLSGTGSPGHSPSFDQPTNPPKVDDEFWFERAGLPGRIPS